MNKLTLFLLTIFALTATSYAASFTAQDDTMKLLWDSWKDAHDKSYSEEEEEAKRLHIFVQNYNKILAHNAGDSTVKLAINRFADLTGEEFKSQYAGGHVPHNQSEEEFDVQGEEKRFLASSSLPSSVDWRQKGALNPVKNQLSCRGCWAFAAAGALEALHYIKTGNRLSFSEQQLLDCDKTSHACNGGNMLRALSYTAKNGIELESNYPFVNRAGSCRASSNKANHVNTGVTSIRANNVNALMSAIVKQPVQVAIESSQGIFQFYKSGVITSGCGASTDHAVLAVGYTTVNGVKAFIVRNSYGPNWGENGYVYISASSSANGGKGVCGILSYAGYPTA